MRVWMLNRSPQRKFLKKETSQNSCRSPRNVLRPREPYRGLDASFGKTLMVGGPKAAGLNCMRRARCSAGGGGARRLCTKHGVVCAPSLKREEMVELPPAQNEVDGLRPVRAVTASAPE